MVSRFVPDNVTCPRAADIVLLLDQSSSIVNDGYGYDNWYVSMLGFATSIVQAFPISPQLTQVGVILFSDRIDTMFHLDTHSNKNSVVSAIRNLDLAGGDTNIAAALRSARHSMFSVRRGARTTVPKILILVTDGKANVEPTRTLLEANLTKSAGIEIFTIGITSSISFRQLRAIATAPWQTHFYYASNFRALSSVLQNLLDNSCKAAKTVAPSYSATTPICYTVEQVVSTTMAPATVCIVPTGLTSTTNLQPTTTTGIYSLINVFIHLFIRSKTHAFIHACRINQKTGIFSKFLYMMTQKGIKYTTCSIKLFSFSCELRMLFLA